jgi:hypothetical protein
MQSSLDNNLLAYWKLNETSGIRFDSTGNNHSISEVNGTVNSTTGILSNAASITNGNITSWLKLPPGICDVGNGQKTFSVWFKINQTSIGYQWIWMQGTGADQRDIGICYIENGSYLNSLFVTDQGSYWSGGNLGGNVVPTANVWHHFACTFSGDTYTAYYDGNQIAQFGYSGAVQSSGSEYTLAHYNSYTNFGAFKGALDEVGIWNRVLSPAEIAALYNIGFGDSYPFFGPSNFVVDLNRGYAGVTEFTFNSYISPAYEATAVLWGFGDGSTSRELNPKHTYYIPGNYTVYLNIYTSSTQVISLTSNVNIDVYLNESIYFDYVPPPTFAGHYNRHPFKVNITSSNTGPHYIDLGAQFSRSYQSQNPSNKWSFLRPQWRFLDLNGNVITSIKTDDTIIKINNSNAIDPTGFVAGVTGTAQFYFVDDIYNFDLAVSRQPYTTLIATLQTSAIRAFKDGVNTDKELPGFSNSLAIATSPHMVLWRTPENIKITENGLRQHSNPRWNGVNNSVIANTDFREYAYPDEWVDGKGVQIASPEDFFIHNYPLSNSNEINLNIGVVGLSANFTPKPTKMVWIDETGYKVPGYYKGRFETSYIDTLGATITANATITMPPLSGNFFNPILWISNPEAGMLATAQYKYQPNLSNATTNNLDVAQIFTFDVPILNDDVDFVKDPMALSGFHGINSIAALPSPNYHAWASDSELNYLYRFSTTGQILCAVDVNKVITDNKLGFSVPKQCSPASIALDGNRNIWMTLYDTVSTLKFDSMGNFLFAVSPLSATGYPLPPKISPDWFGESSYYDANEYPPLGNGDNNFVEPTGLDTDTKDNAWVSYSNYASGYLVKYSPTGGLLKSLTFPLCSCPQEIVVDKNDNVWLALSNHIWNGPSYIVKLNSNGQTLSSFGPYNGVNHLTIDINQNLWFTYSYQWIGSINDNTASVTTLEISGNEITSNIPNWWDPNLNTDETALEGIATDLRGFVYIINSVENQIYVLDSYNNVLQNRFYINPQGFNHVMDDQESPTELIYNVWNKSAQANGDWSGLRWINKYRNRLPYYTENTTTKYLTGKSIPLNFYNNDPYEIFKINENHDLAEQMKSVAFQPILANSNTLFDEFLGPIFGQYPFEADDLGVSSYEKISNFVSNISDADYCNIDELYNISDMVDLDFDNFKLAYPTLIKRLLNFASVNQSRLWGSRLLNQDNFKKPSVVGTLNRGDLITSTYYSISAGEPVVLKTKSLNSYQLIPTGTINGQNIYSLNDLATSIGLENYIWPQFYEFYEFIPSYDNTQIEGLIDWNNPQTTLNETLSTSSDWMGNEGILETLFSHKLYKGLGLID